VRAYIARRLLFFGPVLLAASALTFFAVNIIPGDVAILRLGDAATPQEVESFRAIHGLDRPIVVRYLDWLWGMLRGDPGTSMMGGNIQTELTARLPVTLLILVFSFGFTIFFGISFGIIAAVFQDTKLDYFVRTFSIFGLAVPNFFILTLLLLIPAILWRYAPPFGYLPFWEDPLRAARQVIPPTFVLAIGNAAVLMRLTRSSLLEVLREDYVRTARSKGLKERTVLLRHALKNATIPILTVAGALIAGLLGGSVILENITALPGLGQYFFNATVQRDTNVIMTLVTYSAFVVMTSHLVVDLLYAYVDPRILYR
jgi:peptide/nickel transport system permease protein